MCHIGFLKTLREETKAIPDGTVLPIHNSQILLFWGRVFPISASFRGLSASGILKSSRLTQRAAFGFPGLPLVVLGGCLRGRCAADRPQRLQEGFSYEALQGGMGRIFPSDGEKTRWTACTLRVNRHTRKPSPWTTGGKRPSPYMPCGIMSALVSCYLGVS